ncbi:hypothetical protein PoB_003780800 [Plakobranchus ocellatus]|uniref:Uncharacterized protein n=1 Tax=Plakobranchus ocellatus TaxID=259542 RepID=A0AAV4AV96_9GAST|nr:hypothetical protein PoB_003780800 [Plakobranchus ocellatus]
MQTSEQEETSGCFKANLRAGGNFRLFQCKPQSRRKLQAVSMQTSEQDETSGCFNANLRAGGNFRLFQWCEIGSFELLQGIKKLQESLSTKVEI